MFTPFQFQLLKFIYNIGWFIRAVLDTVGVQKVKDFPNLPHWNSVPQMPTSNADCVKSALMYKNWVLKIF